MTDDDLELWKRVRQGDISARNELVVKNATLVSYWVDRIAPQVPWADREDLMQDGALGLIRAVENFKPERGLEFTTFARYHSRGKIFDSPEITREVHRTQHERIRKVNASYDSLMLTLGRRPTPEEIGSDLGLTVDQVSNAMTAMAIAFTVGLTPYADEETLPNEPRSTIEGHDDRIMIAEALSTLSETEQLVLNWHWHGYSDSDTARKLAPMSQAAVSRARKRALKKLRTLLS
jgi:RNA polymerase sigma factor (sigma-70 family)